MLEIKNLHVEIDTDKGKKEILKGINLKIEKGKIYALMGPNGSGKTTLSLVLMGNPLYNITQGQILFNEKDITNLSPNERAKLGIFLSFQNPVAISGVNVQKFLRQAYNSTSKKKLSVLEFNILLKKKAKELNIDKSFLDRYLNHNFSGGEKKKMEILQLSILNPKFAILDETDSGLDIDALKNISSGINQFKRLEKNKTILIITHYKRILEYIKPDKIFIMNHGKIVQEGSEKLANRLEEEGYGWIEE